MDSYLQPAPAHLPAMKRNQKCKRKGLVPWIQIFLLLFLLTGCESTRYIPPTVQSVPHNQLAKLYWGMPSREPGGSLVSIDDERVDTAFYGGIAFVKPGKHQISYRFYKVISEDIRGKMIATEIKTRDVFFEAGKSYPYIDYGTFQGAGGL